MTLCFLSSATPVAAQETLLDESFADGDYAGWTQWDAHNPGSWSAQSEVLRQTLNRPDTQLFWDDSAAAGWSDYTVEVDVTANDNDDTGLLFYRQDENNYYRFAMNRQKGERRLEKVVNGVVSNLAPAETSSGGFVEGVTYRVTVTIADGSITVAVDDGSNDVTVFDAVPHSDLTQGSIGLYCHYNNSVQFDNISVVSTGAGTSYQIAAIDSFSIRDADSNGTGDSFDNDSWVGHFNGDNAVILAFQIPFEADMTTVSSANLEAYLDRTVNIQSGEPGIDLAAVRVSGDSTSYLTDYEAAATSIMTEYIPASSATDAFYGLSEGGSTALGSWLADNAMAGDYIFLRLSAEVVGNYDRYELGEISNDLGAILTIETGGGLQFTAEQAAARFLTQATMGPTYSEITALAADIETMGEEAALEAWIDDQFSLPATTMDDTLINIVGIDPRNTGKMTAYLWAWWTNAMTAEDQLRFRLNYALSHILVTSPGARAYGANLNGLSGGQSYYYDLLGSHTFGSYRDLLFDVTMSFTMGVYLSHLGNQPADPVDGTNPDENYAREIMQLFSIGLFELNPDGTIITDGGGTPVETYTNATITEFAEVFTGIANEGVFPGSKKPFQPMIMHDAYHDTSSKILLNGTVLPSFSEDPGRTGLDDVNDAIDNIFNHPNVGPFIGRLLIQQLVTSNPTNAYVERVSNAFADNGQGERGDMKAVIKAILLDPEARSASSFTDVEHGKLMDAYLRTVSLCRAMGLYIIDPAKHSYFRIHEVARDVGMEVGMAPSVFNFFLPDHQPPGPIFDAGLVAPEFEIYTDVWGISVPNAMRIVSERDGWIGASGKPVEIDLTPLLDLHSTEGDTGVIERIDLLLCRGLMSDEMRTIIADAMEAVTTVEEKVELAIYLAAISPESAILR